MMHAVSRNPIPNPALEGEAPADCKKPARVSVHLETAVRIVTMKAKGDAEAGCHEIPDQADHEILPAEKRERRCSPHMNCEEPARIKGIEARSRFSCTRILRMRTELFREAHSL